jgi:hypothetical protein
MALFPSLPAAPPPFPPALPPPTCTRRVMLDEAQLVANSNSVAATVVSSLFRRHAWVVTGEGLGGRGTWGRERGRAEGLGGRHAGGAAGAPPLFSAPRPVPSWHFTGSQPTLCAAMRQHMPHAFEVPAQPRRPSAPVQARASPPPLAYPPLIASASIATHLGSLNPLFRPPFRCRHAHLLLAERGAGPMRVPGCGALLPRRRVEAAGGRGAARTAPLLRTAHCAPHTLY